MIAKSFPALLQSFFTERLFRQRRASGHTIAGYRDAFRLLLRYAAERLGTAPSKLRLEDLDASFIGQFLDHLEHDVGDFADAIAALGRSAYLAVKGRREGADYGPAVRGGLKKGLAMAFKGGAVTGMIVAGLALTAVAGFYTILIQFAHQDFFFHFHTQLNLSVYFSMGAPTRLPHSVQEPS